MPLAAEMEPPLTTVRQRPEKLGEAAVALLLESDSGSDRATKAGRFSLQN